MGIFRTVVASKLKFDAHGFMNKLHPSTNFLVQIVHRLKIRNSQTFTGKISET